MLRHPGSSLPILASALIACLALPAAAQTPRGTDGSSTTAPAVPPAPSSGRNVSATGKMMPPPSGRTPDAAAKPIGAPTNASIAAEMLKAQKAADARNKDWDSRMRKTMGSICSGC